MFYVGSGMMLVGVLLSRVSDWAGLRFLALLGAYSYSIYLWHMPVRVWGTRLLDLGGVDQDWFALRAVGYLCGSITLGLVMAKVVEVPALRLRNRLFPAGDQRALERSGGLAGHRNA